MIKIIRHAFALIREDKLFSTIYVAGTAVAIASAMVIAIFLNIKLADIPPESNRSRTLYPLYGTVAARSIPCMASSPSRWPRVAAVSTCATPRPPSTLVSDS